MTEETETTKVVEETKSAEHEQPELAPIADDPSTSPTKIGDEVSEAPTLRDFFGIPEKASDQGDDYWQAFQKKLAEETQGIKWMAAMPDLGSKIGELLGIKIHDMLLTAWKKVEAVRQAIEESKKTPDKATYLDLTEHSIDYETKPFIDVKIKSASVKKLTLTVAINLKVKGFGLKIQNGAIRELQTGKCEAKGTIKYEKLSIAEKKLEPIKFPFTIEIPSLIAIPERAAEPPDKPVVSEPVAPTSDKTRAVSESHAEEDLERIEL
jgi:hypothetical protein